MCFGLLCYLEDYFIGYFIKKVYSNLSVQIEAVRDLSQSLVRVIIKKPLMFCNLLLLGFIVKVSYYK